MPLVGAAPSHYTNATWSNPTADRPTQATLEALSKLADTGTAIERSASLAFADAASRNENPYESEEYQLLDRIRSYKGMLDDEQAELRSRFRRFDNLYHPTIFTTGGADHWPEHALGNKGKTHVSVNVHRAYVDIPAALQAAPPYENVIPKENTQAAREAAALAERLYMEWLEQDDREEKDQLACQVKGLYGFTFGKVYWDAEREMPTLQVIENPEDLYVGYGSDDYRRIDWTIYCYGISPQAVEEDYGLSVAALPDASGKTKFPYVYQADHADPLGTIFEEWRERGGRKRDTAYERMHVEVYDFWYKKPKGKGKKPEIWNAIFVGNKMVENAKHTEYDQLPYLPLLNARIPGSPYGPSDLHDVEQLLREKDERVTEQAQMIHSIVGGQRWQIVGPEAPDEVPAGALPGPGGVAAPGPNAEIKAITPFVPEFAIEDYNRRIDMEVEKVTGLNEVILGTVPTSALNSSKALTALVANYEARNKPKRSLFYSWRRAVWEMAAKVWERKDRDVRKLIDGHYRLDIQPADVAYRDDLENATKAINLVQNGIWSRRRAADATGVEDPEGELDTIREEQTDATLNPAAVLTQIQLMSGIQSLGAQQNPQNEEALATAQRQSANATRQQVRPAAGSASANAPAAQGNPPPAAQPGNTPEGGLLSQTMIDSNGLSGRLLSQQKL
jgi:hypothetical protein